MHCYFSPTKSWLTVFFLPYAPALSQIPVTHGLCSLALHHFWSHQLFLYSPLTAKPQWFYKFTLLPHCRTWSASQSSYLHNSPLHSLFLPPVSNLHHALPRLSASEPASLPPEKQPPLMASTGKPQKMNSISHIQISGVGDLTTWMASPWLEGRELTKAHGLQSLPHTKPQSKPLRLELKVEILILT